MNQLIAKRPRLRRKRTHARTHEHTLPPPPLPLSLLPFLRFLFFFQARQVVLEARFPAPRVLFDSFSLACSFFFLGLPFR